MDRFIVKTKGIIDGTGAPMLPGAQMLITGGRIEKIGVSLSDERVIDLSDFYVLPGLIDSHTHLSVVPGEGNQLAQMALPCARNVVRSYRNFRTQFESGVTSMRIMGEENDLDFEVRRGIEEGYFEGPRLFISGTPIVASNGHAVTLTASDGVDGVRRNIRKNFKKGANFVKIFITGGMSSSHPPVDFCSFTVEEVEAAVEEANRMKTYVAAHAHGGPGVDVCIKTGVHSIEHGALASDDQIERMKAAGMFVVLTTSILFSPEGIEKTDFSNPAIKAKVLENRTVAADTCGRIIKSKMNWALGTDAMHGMMYYEMANAVKYGATNMEAIMAATLRGAELLSMKDKLGSLEQGKFADFIVLRGNPLEDIGAIRDIACVFKGGILAVDKR